MHTIRLRVNDKIYKHLIWFLGRFSKEEIQVIQENSEFLSIQEYLKKELHSIEEGTTEYLTIEDLDNPI